MPSGSTAAPPRSTSTSNWREPTSPELENGQAVYKVTPEEFAAACRQILKAGIHILGGCCGTSPEHIRAVASALR
jgi:methionine synthase I (cobalamin-dependent)